MVEALGPGMVASLYQCSIFIAIRQSRTLSVALIASSLAQHHQFRYRRDVPRFLRATEPKEKLVNAPPLPTLRGYRPIVIGLKQPTSPERQEDNIHETDAA